MKKSLKPMKSSEIDVEFSIDVDGSGFALNVDVQDQEGFSGNEVPAYLILVARSLCRETGISFNKLIQNALSMESSKEWLSPTTADA